jgi:hypothetical protein
MAVSPTILAEGQLETSVTAIYTAAGDTYLTSLILSNVSGGSGEAHLYIKANGSSDRAIIPDGLTMDDGDTLYIQALKGSLNNGDAIRGYADIPSGIDYIIWGGTV